MPLMQGWRAKVTSPAAARAAPSFPPPCARTSCHARPAKSLPPFREPARIIAAVSHGAAGARSFSPQAVVKTGGARGPQTFKASLAYPDPLGLPALREAIASYLAVSRGIACQPGQIAITGGYQAALNLAAGLLLAPGDLVWFEDPGYGFARDALQSLSFRIAPVPVDGEGLLVAHGSDIFRRRDWLSSPRRINRRWAFACPCRAVRLCWPGRPKPIPGYWKTITIANFIIAATSRPALKSIDGGDRVFYAGSFSKTLFPGLRLGYLVLPSFFIAKAASACRVQHRGEATFGQVIVATFMADGHFARHLRRMRMHYKARRQALADALALQFGDDIRLSLPPGGLHILGPLSQSWGVILRWRSALPSRPAALPALRAIHQARRRTRVADEFHQHSGEVGARSRRRVAPRAALTPQIRAMTDSNHGMAAMSPHLA